MSAGGSTRLGEPFTWPWQRNPSQWLDRVTAAAQALHHCERPRAQWRRLTFTEQCNYLNRADGVLRASYFLDLTPARMTSNAAARSLSTMETP